ncbi:MULTISPECIES: hypothetical protein [unclassified Nocardiopsis]|uniref:hypothetical protein n=1 Tax=unclassified Nocardiopsis TaxID=2649073 RepID=UPI00135B9241|nr:MULTISPECIES: hypothetical protein [unclassified Nocardiopsis]
MDHWKVARPISFQRIPEDERETFFADLGEQAQRELESTWISLAGDDRPEETMQDKEGRLAMARLAAREKVMAEMILLPEDPTAFSQEEPTWEDVEETNSPTDSLAEWMAQEDPDGEGPQDPQEWMEWYSRRNG